MSVILYLILLALSGLIVGALARLLLPGRDPMSIVATMGVGIAGSFIAGLIVYAISGRARGGGLLLSILVSVGLVYLIRRTRRGSTASVRPSSSFGGRGGPFNR
jgi:uncharacterized membrane protein YeaQ/YmgE (transglycosylase-associated protein family)